MPIVLEAKLVNASKNFDIYQEDKIKEARTIINDIYIAKLDIESNGVAPQRIRVSVEAL